MSFWDGLSESSKNAAFELAAALNSSKVQASDVRQGDAGYVRFNTGAIHEMQGMKPAGQDMPNFH